MYTWIKVHSKLGYSPYDVCIDVPEWTKRPDDFIKQHLDDNFKNVDRWEYVNHKAKTS